jgi:16S rRNA (guanine1207-N2)-methyltransferase
MKLQSCMLCETVQFSANTHLLILNSASDPFVRFARERFQSTGHNGAITLAEDNIAAIQALLPQKLPNATSERVIRHTAFHNYILHSPEQTVDIAVLNLLYQPSKTWMLYALQVALYALHMGGQLYVTGAKDRGVMTIGRHIEESFGNMETLLISKGQRVLRATKTPHSSSPAPSSISSLPVFASNELDEGTQLLLQALDVHVSDQALDIGCGAGFIGVHIARLATRGHVTMVDASLLAVATAHAAVEKSQLGNVDVLASDGAKAVIDRRFDLVVTNPPFHQGGVQGLATGEQFIREAAHVLRPTGHFYLVANRFLKYEPTLRAYFTQYVEVGGNTRYKVLRARLPQKGLDD